jgi:hypothetical protein
MTIKIAAFFAASALVFACGSDNKQTPADAAKSIDAPKVIDAPMTTIDAPLTDAGVVIDASCFTNPDPMSHYQLINACTTAQKVYTTHPKPPLTLPDGGLPTLPP